MGALAEVMCDLPEEAQDFINADLARMEAEAALAEAMGLIRWYGEKASALASYAMPPIRDDAMEAVVTELTLDAGRRAAAFITKHGGGQ